MIVVRGTGVLERRPIVSGSASFISTHRTIPPRKTLASTLGHIYISLSKMSIQVFSRKRCSRKFTILGCALGGAGGRVFFEPESPLARSTIFGIPTGFWTRPIPKIGRSSHDKNLIPGKRSKRQQNHQQQPSYHPQKYLPPSHVLIPRLNALLPSFCLSVFLCCFCVSVLVLMAEQSLLRLPFAFERNMEGKQTFLLEILFVV